MIEGKAEILDSCRHRKMKLSETPTNLLETQVKAEGNLDGMDVRVEMNCITGMPGESHGTVTFKGNLGQLLSVLARIWPGSPESREVVSPGRQSWPDYQVNRKEEED